MATTDKDRAPAQPEAEADIVGPGADGTLAARGPAIGRKLLQMGFGRAAPEGVRLHPLEAAFLLERKLIRLQDATLTPPRVLAAAPAPGAPGSPFAPGVPAEDQYLIFRALRRGGHMVRFSAGSPEAWRACAKGVGREQDRAQMFVIPVGPEWGASLASLEQQLMAARLLRLDLVLAFVRDGRPHLIKVSKPPLEG